MADVVASEELRVLVPRRFEDDRGYFVETYNKRRFAQETDFAGEFVQDNHSYSARGTLRGLHYQLPPNEQAKLVRVVSGSIFDVVVDIRRSSPGYAEWYGIELSAARGNQLWIPEGFAHGFLALADDTEVVYKTTEFYAPEAERTILWSDPRIGIEWPVSSVRRVLVSDKDANAPSLDTADTFD